LITIFVEFDSWMRSIDKKDEYSCYGSVHRSTRWVFFEI